MPSKPTSTEPNDELPTTNDQSHPEAGHEDTKIEKNLEEISTQNEGLATLVLGLSRRLKEIETQLARYHADVMMIAEEVLRKNKPGNPLSPPKSGD